MHSEPDAGFLSRDARHGEPHDHANVAEHTHAAAADLGAVYIDEDDADAAQGTTHQIKRSALDLDGHGSGDNTLVAIGATTAPAVHGAPSYRSRVAPRLERPPRTNA